MPVNNLSAGSREVRRDVATGLILEEQRSYFGFLVETRTCVINALRAFFRDNPYATNCRWAGLPTTSGHFETDVKLSQLHIAGPRPVNPQLPRGVLVRGVAGRNRELWFNAPVQKIYITNEQFSVLDRDASEADGVEYLIPEELHVGERLRGVSEYTVTLDVNTIHELELDELADLVQNALLGQVRIDLAKLAMHVLPDSITVGGEQFENRTNQQGVNFRLVTFGLRTEWYRDFYYQVVNVTDVRVDQVTREPQEPLLPA